MYKSRNTRISVSLFQKAWRRFEGIDGCGFFGGRGFFSGCGRGLYDALGMIFTVAKIFAAAFAFGVLFGILANFAIAMTAGGFSVIAVGLVAPHFAAFNAADMAVGEFAGIGFAASFAIMLNLFEAGSVTFIIETIAVDDGMLQFIADEMTGNAASADGVSIVLLMTFYAAIQSCAAGEAEFRIGEVVFESLFFIVPAGMCFAAIDTFATVCAPDMNVRGFSFSFSFVR